MRLQVNNVSKSYGDFEAIKDVSFQVNDRQIVGLLGRNGAGKTTLIKMILKIINADSGDIGIEYNNENHSIGFLPEERGLYLNMTVKAQLMFIARINKLSKEDSLKSIKHYLNELEIPEYLNEKVKKLSKGNKQKIQLISALVHNPNLVVLDEPFSGLDPVNVILFKNVIRKYRDKNKIILLSSHRLEDVEEMCDMAVLLKDGKVLVKGSLESIKSSYSYENVFKIVSRDDITQYIQEYNLTLDDRKKDSFIIKSINRLDVYNMVRNILEDNIQILSFEKLQTSLNDIFVKEL